MRAIKRWNNLSQEDIDTATVNSFKSRLEMRRKRQMDFFKDWMSTSPLAARECWNWWCSMIRKIAPGAPSKHCNMKLWHVKVKGKGIPYSPLMEVFHGTAIRSATCHMGSHGVACYPTQVNTPCLNPSHTGRYSIYLARRDGRLSWPSWLNSAPAGSRTCDISITSPTLNHCNHQDNVYYCGSFEYKLILHKFPKVVQGHISRQMVAYIPASSVPCLWVSSFLTAHQHIKGHSVP